MLASQSRTLITVSKVVRSYPPFLQKMNSLIPGTFADTRRESLFNAMSVTQDVLLLNPSPEQIDPELEGIQDIYTADPRLIKKISDLDLNPKPHIILSLEAGGLREGIPPEDLLEAAREIERLPGVRFKGIGATYGCLLGLFPEDKDLLILAEGKKMLENQGIACPVVSAGGTILMDRILENNIPREINHIRLGEAVFFGYNTFTQRSIPGFRQRCFTLKADILESFQKNTDIGGNFGVNIFGRPGTKGHPLLNKGKRHRALVDFGSAMIGSKANITPDSDGTLLALSYEQGVMDFDDDKRRDSASFLVNYDGVARLMLYPYLRTQIEQTNENEVIRS